MPRTLAAVSSASSAGAQSAIRVPEVTPAVFHAAGSPYKTVKLDGVTMTPAQAYAAARGKPDSAD
ncbi:hypothetical protein [Streptomyces sp. NPDC051129]|uniref:hypothetical protein n=1 Tax=Streptomyces sp. NPDC051129 TaxID=3154639 RepID=UPI00341E1C20